MPISKEKRALYPQNWKQISRRIRDEAGNKCEECGAKNYEPHPITGSKVILTVAHYPDENPANCSRENLHCLCQRCHNRLDSPMRVQHAKATRRAKLDAQLKAHGQKGLFDD